MSKAVLLLLAAVVACSAPPPGGQATPSPTDSASAMSASPSVSISSAPITTSAPTPVATRAIAPNDLGARIRVLATSWRGAGRTLVFATSDGDRTTLVAIPVSGGGQPVAFLELTSATGWQFRPDGGALAIAFQNGDNTSRIATWEVASGAARWVTPDEPAISVASPVWSPDGLSIYFSERFNSPSYADRGLFRVSLADLGTTLVHGPDRNGGDPVSVSPDGRWLIWTRGQAGGSTDVLDLATGVNKTFDVAGASGLVAWRSARPRALVMATGCCAGRPGGQLILWDDTTGATTELIGPNSAPLLSAGLADWDPSGTRIATSVIERSTILSPNRTDSPVFIAIFDASGKYLSRIPDTQAIWLLAWLPEGILVGPSSFDGTFELRLISESGDSSRLLYRTTKFNLRLAAIISPP